MPKNQVAKKKILLYVEGDTEKNYFSDFNRLNKDKLCITFKDINKIGGGGYTSFIQKLKKENVMYGYLAVFIVLDMDRLLNGERGSNKLQELVTYCNKKNKEESVPYFLIVSNPDFEFFLCSHCKNFSNQEKKSFITKNLPYKGVSELKADEKVYEVFNRDGRCYNNALDKIRIKKVENRIVHNDFTCSKKGLDIKIRLKKIIFNENNINIKQTNLFDLFDIILK